MTQLKYMTDTIRLGRKGQVTIPKKIRDMGHLKEDDQLIVTNMPGGDIILRKKIIENPIDRALEIISNAPHFDWRKAWKEVLEERKRERS